MVEPAASAAAVEAYKDGRSLLSYFSRKFSYANNLDDNYKSMMSEATKLYARRDDVEAKVNRDKTKRFSREGDTWISEVKNMEKEVLELETKHHNENSCSWGCRWFWLRSNLSKRMKKKCDALHDLWVDRRGQEGFMVDRSPEPSRIMHAPNIRDKPSLYLVVEEILDFLRDETVRRIGLWGMVGIGKTTILQNLNDDENTAKMFDIVIWVAVSKEWSIEKLQHVIAERLKLNTGGITDPFEIALIISRELQCKRYLLLLDEVWEVLDLQAIGIHDTHMHSKVVLATRYRDICCDMDEIVHVKKLPEADAWKMFQGKVGPNINLPGIEPIAQLVAKECAGLPLVIDKIAKTFRKKNDVHLWRAGLKGIRRWTSLKIQGMNEMLEFLKYCYEDLDDEGKKACFLYGSLYPEDCEIYIDYLLECWKAEGLIRDTDEFSKARDEGHGILDDLIKVSLLERCADVKHVRMNKVLRNMALNISLHSKNSRFLVRAREGLLEPPKEEEWERANRISLMDNKLCTLPEAPNCGNLSTLLLQRNSKLTMIPKLFFGSMQCLNVLDLHATGITSLPPSTSFLTSLKALYLNSCINLEALPSCMEALELLEVLDIRGSGISYLPIQIKSLTQLRCLRMSLSNVGLGGSYKEIFSNLKLLEELSIEVGSYSQLLDEVVRDITMEVATLEKLTSLTICFPKVDCLQIFITSSPSWKNIHFTFQFSVGYNDSNRYRILDPFEYKIYKCLKYSNGEGVDGAISEVLSETQCFELIGHKGASSLSDFGINSFNKMRGCLIEGCADIETIVNGGTISKGALESLEKMIINNMPKLVSIWEGPVHVGSLSGLTNLTISKCPLLKKIFPKGVIQQLLQLQLLKIEDCSEVEEMIEESENMVLEPAALPRLKTVTLADLPRLRSIWINDSLEWPSLVKLSVLTCPSLKKLPFNNGNAAKLRSRSIVVEEAWWRNLEWQDDAIEQRLSSFCHFT